MANEKEKLDEPDNSKSSPTVDEVAILKEELEQLKGSVISKLEENVRGLKEELATSKEELATLKGQVDFCKSEATVTFELKDIEALLAAGSGQERNSKVFACGGEFNDRLITQVMDLQLHFSILEPLELI